MPRACTEKCENRKSLKMLRKRGLPYPKINNEGKLAKKCASGYNGKKVKGWCTPKNMKI